MPQHPGSCFCVCVLQTVLDAFLYPDTRQMAAELSAQTGPGFRKMNDAVRKGLSHVLDRLTRHDADTCGGLCRLPSWWMSTAWLTFRR